MNSIGRIIAYSSMMDALVAKIISHLLKFYKLADDPEGKQMIGIAVTAHINTNARVNILESLANMVQEPPVKTKLDQLVRACRTHFDHRDHIAHSTWIFGDDNQPIAAKFIAKNEVKSVHRPMSSTLLKQWANEAQAAMFELNGFYNWQRAIAYDELGEELPQSGSLF